MVRAWKTLMAAGVPLGAIRRPRRRWDLGEVSRALRAIASQALTTVESEALFAWLKAFEHHWPTTFDQVLGESGRKLAHELSTAVTDENRYLKLRRIAIENLSPRL